MYPSMPPNPEPSEQMERCFVAHYPAISAYFLRRCATATDAAEATTDVFTIAWRRFADMPPEPERRLWLYGVARRVLADHVRSDRRRQRLGARLQALTPAVGGPDIGAATVEAIAMRAALRTLPDGDRELLALAGWDGLSPAEIASVLAVPAPVVSARLYRARRRLARRLADATGVPETTTEGTAPCTT